VWTASAQTPAADARNEPAGIDPRRRLARRVSASEVIPFAFSVYVFLQQGLVQPAGHFLLQQGLSQPLAHFLDTHGPQRLPAQPGRALVMANASSAATLRRATRRIS
jgi:hypothetical protein